MAQYLLSVHHGPSADAAMADMAEADMQRMFTNVGAFNDDLKAQGAWVFAGGLEPITATTCIDATGDGDPLITDGPFSESKEYLGGFWIIEAADLDAALAWAARGSAACEGKVEVRPFQGE